MKFGPVPVSEAEGAILAHSLTVSGQNWKKGHRLEAKDLALFRGAGLDQVTVAQLEPGDIGEDAAAEALAAALVPDPEAAKLRVEAPFTGRVNIRATGPGIVEIDAAAVARLNAVHPMITLATVPEWQRVVDRTMVGTVKIISYAVPEAALEAACAAGRGALHQRVPVCRSADLIVTATAGQTVDPEEKGIAAVWTRVTRLGIAQGSLEIVDHAIEAVTEAIARSRADLVLILTGSATSDVADVAPAAVVAAGGQITRFGMPVDPGNLLVLGSLGARPVIGLPGCARSPALNGADWVLERVACGVELGDADIAAMGVGGLLKEIPSRPQPRDGRPTKA